MEVGGTRAPVRHCNAEVAYTENGALAVDDNRRQ